MKITKELILKVHDYITNNPKLYKNFEYLYVYKFVGFENLKGTTVGDYISSYNSGGRFCTMEIFVEDITISHDESEEELVKRLSEYAVNYLTCLAALDMFISRFTQQFFTPQHLTKLLYGKHVLAYNNILEFNVGDSNSGVIIEDVGFTIESDDYKLVDKALDLKLKINMQRYNRQDFGQWYIKVSELNKDKLEEFMLAAGW